ncbi:MAG: hypothetical protein ACETWD_07240 [Desulfatiglandales bacterium]
MSDIMKYILAYALSVGVGIPVTLWWSNFHHKRVQKYKTEKDEQAERDRLIPLLLGVFERLIITTLVGWKVPGTGAFIAGWFGLKSAGGWSSWSKGTTYGRATFFAGLLGSMMSLLFAIVGGLIIAELRSSL